jgi:hypothetical protein
MTVQSLAVLKRRDRIGPMDGGMCRLLQEPMMSDSELGSGPLEYAETTDSEFAALAASSFAAERMRTGIVMLHGRCPRCTSVISVPIFESVFRLGSKRSHRRQEQAEPVYHTVMCTCDDDHPGRPTGQLGCGAYWTVVLQEGEG